MKTTSLCLALAVAAAGWLGRWAWRAHHDLVTLEVREMPLAQVVSRLRWQTWEPILLGEGVAGTVTLRVKDQPLETVLNILNEQVSGRWTAVYPLYSTRKSLAAAKRLAAAGSDATMPGWTNWNSRPSRPAGELQPASFRPNNAPEGRGGGFGPGRELTSTRTASVALALTNATALAAAQSIRRQSGARVVPEDGTALKLSLTTGELPLKSAVAEVARKVHRKWTRLYVLEARRTGPPIGSAIADTERPERPALTDEQRQAMEQRRAQMEADPARQEAAINRMLGSLQNSTPQQRTERDAQRLARKRAQAAR